MTLLSIAQSLAVNVSIPATSDVKSSTTDDARKIVQFTQEAADEITRRVDWSMLRKTASFTGTGGDEEFGLPADFARLITGTGVKVGTATVRVGLTPDEWNSLTPVEGTPRYARLAGRTIAFYPYPAAGQEVILTYQSNAWNGSSNTSVWASDGDVPLISEELIRLGAVWRWRRHIGLDYQDHVAEFEGALEQMSRFDDGIRTP
jgi:hypothetical protein